MGWTQKICYEEIEVVLPPPVKKQFWDGTQFVALTLYKFTDTKQTTKILDWLKLTYGRAGQHIKGHYWEYSKAGQYFFMDEEVYVWYKLKWREQ